MWSVESVRHPPAHPAYCPTPGGAKCWRAVAGFHKTARRKDVLDFGWYILLDLFLIYINIILLIINQLIKPDPSRGGDGKQRVLYVKMAELPKD